MAPRQHNLKSTRDGSASAASKPAVPPNPREIAAPPPSGNASAVDVMALQLLLSIEEQVRKVPDLSALRHFAVNETRKLNASRQIFLVEVRASKRHDVTAVSGLGTFDPSSIMADDIGKVVETLRVERGSLADAVGFTLPAFAAETVDIKQSYPFRECLWMPLTKRNGQVFAGLLCARESVWSAADIAITTRLAAAYGYAWQALSPWSARAALIDGLNRRRAAILALLGLALLVPVPITALAPAEIVARDREIIAAPMDGVLESIDVEPSDAVKSGQSLARLVDITLRNRRDVAAQEKAVAEARVKQATLMAFNDAKGRFELGIAQAELELKLAELAFTDEQLARTVIRAPRDGVVVFADKRSMIGKPVATGERLMEIVDPRVVEVRIDVAAPDAIALGEAPRAKIFLDIEPLSSRRATITRTDYRARPNDSDVLTFRAFAQLESDDQPPRLGLRGTAQVLGDRAPLVFVLLRRPIAAVRQWLGL